MLQHPYDSCLPTIIIQQGLQEQGLLFSTISLTLPCLPFLHRLPRLDYIKLAVEGDIRPSSISTVLYSLRTQLKGRVRSMHVYLEQSWVGAEEAWRELGRSTALTKLRMGLAKEVRDGCLPTPGLKSGWGVVPLGH
jgi:hypothetical protein